MNERIPLAYLMPLRLLMALILIVEGWQKLRAGWFHGDALYGITQTWMDTHRPYAPFGGLLRTAHAHPKIFSALVTLGELYVGLSLLGGVATRLASFVGVLLMGAIAGVSGQGLAPPGNALLSAVILLTFVAAPPGRLFGVDQYWLRARLPRWMA
jgi:uncharacterized membrane protein YphA (DoxX/SURF4 family)